VFWGRVDVIDSVGFGIFRSPRIVAGVTSVGFGLGGWAELGNRAAVVVSVEFGVAGLAGI
jgi:hypothetical protein